jgi:hypothetical protein
MSFSNAESRSLPSLLWPLSKQQMDKIAMTRTIIIVDIPSQAGL